MSSIKIAAHIDISTGKLNLSVPKLENLNGYFVINLDSNVIYSGGDGLDIVYDLEDLVWNNFSFDLPKIDACNLALGKFCIDFHFTQGVDQTIQSQVTCKNVTTGDEQQCCQRIQIPIITDAFEISILRGGKTVVNGSFPDLASLSQAIRSGGGVNTINFNPIQGNSLITEMEICHDGTRMFNTIDIDHNQDASEQPCGLFNFFQPDIVELGIQLKDDAGATILISTYDLFPTTLEAEITAINPNATVLILTNTPGLFNVRICDLPELQTACVSYRMNFTQCEIQTASNYKYSKTIKTVSNFDVNCPPSGGFKVLCGFVVDGQSVNIQQVNIADTTAFTEQVQIAFPDDDVTIVRKLGGNVTICIESEQDKQITLIYKEGTAETRCSLVQTITYGCIQLFGDTTADSVSWDMVTESGGVLDRLGTEIDIDYPITTLDSQTLYFLHTARFGNCTATSLYMVAIDDLYNKPELCSNVRIEQVPTDNEVCKPKIQVCQLKFNFCPKILDYEQAIKTDYDCTTKLITAQQTAELPKGITRTSHLWTIYPPTLSGEETQTTGAEILKYQFKWTGPYQIQLQQTLTEEIQNCVIVEGSLDKVVTVNVECNFSTQKINTCIIKAMADFKRKAENSGGYTCLSMEDQEMIQHIQLLKTCFDSYLANKDYKNASKVADEIEELLHCDCGCGGKEDRPVCIDEEGTTGIVTTYSAKGLNCIKVTPVQQGANLEFCIELIDTCLLNEIDVSECLTTALGLVDSSKIPQDLLPNEGEEVSICEFIEFITQLAIEAYNAQYTDLADLNLKGLEDCFLEWLAENYQDVDPACIPNYVLFNWNWCFIQGDIPDCAVSPCEEIKGDLSIQQKDWSLAIEHVGCSNDGRFLTFEINWEYAMDWEVNIAFGPNSWVEVDQNTRQVTIDTDPDGDGQFDMASFLLRARGINVPARRTIAFLWNPTLGCVNGLAGGFEIKNASGACLTKYCINSASNLAYTDVNWIAESGGELIPVLANPNEIYVNYSDICRIPGECNFQPENEGTLAVSAVTIIDGVVCEQRTGETLLPECCGCLDCEEEQVDCLLKTFDQGGGVYYAETLFNNPFFLFSCDPPSNYLQGNVALPPVVLPDGSGGVDGNGSPYYFNDGTVPIPAIDCDQADALNLCGWFYNDVEILEYNGTTILFKITGPDPKVGFRGIVDEKCVVCCCVELNSECLMGIKAITNIRTCDQDDIQIPFTITGGSGGPYTVTGTHSNGSLVFSQSIIGTAGTIVIQPNSAGYADGTVTIDIIDQSNGCIASEEIAILIEECECPLMGLASYDCQSGLSFNFSGEEGSVLVFIQPTGGVQVPAQPGEYYDNGTYEITFVDTDDNSNTICETTIELAIDCTKEDCDDIFNVSTQIILT